MVQGPACPWSLDIYDTARLAAADDDEIEDDAGGASDDDGPLIETSHARKKRPAAKLVDDDRFKPGVFLMVRPDAGDQCPWWLGKIVEGGHWVHDENASPNAAPTASSVATAIVQWYQPANNDPSLYTEQHAFRPCLQNGRPWTDAIDLRTVQQVVFHPYMHPRDGSVRVPAKYLTRK